MTLKLPNWKSQISGIPWLLLIMGMMILPQMLPAQTGGCQVRYGVPPVECHISGEWGHARVGPPAGFLDSLKSAVKKGDLIVSYVDFPDSARVAMEYAVSVWESLIASDLPIYVEARWEKLGTTTLGSCGAESYHVNFEGAPVPDTWYPVALVEKITGREITGAGSPDMTASFNSSIPWYFGTDLNTPVDKYDFVSTVLHEIGHGLGFNGFLDADVRARTGSYGYSDDLPAVFDRLVEDAASRQLTDLKAYENPSAALYYVLISDQLYAESPSALILGDGQRPRLYAPPNFTVGSSIYHLNDQSYPYGTPNALMTSSAGSGEAIHNPGPLTTGLLYDLGWKHLWIHFTPLKDREDISAPLLFEATVVSEAGLRDQGLRLVYSTDQFKTGADTLSLSGVAGSGDFSGELLPGPGVLSYYLTASDTLGRTFTSPAGAPTHFWTVNLGLDTIKPEITHTPAKYLLTNAEELQLGAIVTDNAWPDTVYAEFRLNSLELPAVGLIREAGDTFRRGVPLKALQLKGGDLLEYRIIALDNAHVPNRRELPATGYFRLACEALAEPVTTYYTGFTASGNDFILYDFSVNLFNGFADPALHSPHPYPSPDADNQEIQLTATLRVPIIVRERGRIAWEEVVLVEPGEEGARYGSEEFYDYVIAEGSNDGGKSWLPLLNGYDSGSRPAWKSAYNSKINGQNSVYQGTRDLYARREFLITGNGNFREGDTLLIRFRLYSDFYAHGWGWAIDNLDIQQNLTASEPLAGVQPDFQLWPNPATDRIHFLVEGGDPSGDYSIVITDLAGRTLLSLPPGTIVAGQSASLSLDPLPPGLYFVRLLGQGPIRAVRKFIRL